MDMCLVVSTVDSPCALLVDIAASVRVSGETAALGPRTPAERGTHGLHARDTHSLHASDARRPSTRETSPPRHRRADCPGSSHTRRRRRPARRLRRRLRRQRLPDARRGDGLLLHAPQKKNSATQNEKTTLKTKKNRKAEKHLKLGLPALKLAIAQNPIKGFFKAFFDFSPAEGSVTYAENTVSTRK